ncbi:MAG: exodeoxyribonuclease III [Bacteroidetes bacterium]|nr:exodeoxyribonuclease III [Bacteroidota bacterium]
MKIISFNVNGIRAIVGKTFLHDMSVLQPDIICLQETKATEEQVKEAISALKDYEVYANSAERKGYSGTAILSKIAPEKVSYGMGIPEHDREGRIVCATFADFHLICVYVPNSGSELLRLGYRQTWDRDFLVYLKGLESSKPVVVCGDFNVANHPIDLARPRDNYNKSAGYMQEEIDGMNNFTSSGFIDTFRFLNPNKIKYSWWSYRAGARQKNIGWRIDYFLVSKSLINTLKAAEIYNDVHGSDHCPVVVEL